MPFLAIGNLFLARGKVHCSSRSQQTRLTRGHSSFKADRPRGRPSRRKTENKKVFYAKISHAAAVVDATVGGSHSWPCRSELPLLSDKTRFNAQWSTLAAKGPAQSEIVIPDAQPRRPMTNKPRSIACPCHQNHLNIARLLKAWIMFFGLFYKLLKTRLFRLSSLHITRGLSYKCYPAQA